MQLVKKRKTWAIRDAPPQLTHIIIIIIPSFNHLLACMLVSPVFEGCGLKNIDRAMSYGGHILCWVVIYSRSLSLSLHVCLNTFIWSWRERAHARRDECVHVEMSLKMYQRNSISYACTYARLMRDLGWERRASLIMANACEHESARCTCQILKIHMLFGRNSTAKALAQSIITRRVCTQRIIFHSCDGCHCATFNHEWFVAGNDVDSNVNVNNEDDDSGAGCDRPIAIKQFSTLCGARANQTDSGGVAGAQEYRAADGVAQTESND